MSQPQEYSRCPLSIGYLHSDSKDCHTPEGICELLGNHPSYWLLYVLQDLLIRK